MTFPNCRQQSKSETLGENKHLIDTDLVCVKAFGTHSKTHVSECWLQGHR